MAGASYSPSSAGRRARRTLPFWTPSASTRLSPAGPPSLPSGVANAGSIFRNPPGDFAGRLLDECGLKGAREGGAEVSPKHANVIVNTGGATARDVVALMRRMRSAVAERSGVALVPEVVLLGELRAELEAAV